MNYNYNHINRLLSEAQKNRERLVERLCHLHYQRLYAMALQLTNNNEQAKDIIQDSFLALYNNLHELSSAEMIDEFLVTTTRNACMKYRQQLREENEYTAAFEYLSAKDEYTAENALIEAEVLQAIEMEIEKLPKERKKIIKQLKEGRTYKEIAAQFQLSEQTVRNHRSLAVLTLRKALLKKLW